MVSPQRRLEIIDALRRGTVPQRGLGSLAVGLQRFESAILEELDQVSQGRAVFKAVRGEYGCGKTFFARWLQETAKARGFACAELQISESETPLHRLETVYRRGIERLSTSDTPDGAFRNVVDAWFFVLEEDVLAAGEVHAHDPKALLEATEQLMESRLNEVTRKAPAFAAALRAYHRAVVRGDQGQADGLLAWLSGQPHVAANIKRAAGIKGDLDHFGAMSFLKGLLLILRDAGRNGLIMVLDEVETLQRVRRDVRDKALNALRQWVDDLDAGQFPGLYLLITGTHAFFEGNQGVNRLPPLAQRLAVDFDTEERFDNPRAVQIRLPSFDHARLIEVGLKVRDIFALGNPNAARILQVVDDGFVEDLAQQVGGAFGGRVGVAPRVFLKKLVGDVLDRVDQFPDFDPKLHYALTVQDRELSEAERNARPANDMDEITLSDL